MNLQVPDERILMGVAATLTVTFVDQYGTAADAVGVVTVDVVQGDGTAILTGAATTHGATGVYTTALTAAQIVSLNLLTATWKDGGVARATTLIEVCGGFYFSIAEARASDPTLGDTIKYPDAMILAARLEVESECEVIDDIAFVPRYRRVTLDGSAGPELLLPDNQLRTVRSVRVFSDLGAHAAVDLTATQLAAIALSDDVTIKRTDRGIFDEGVRNVVVEYEHGCDRPPPDLKRAVLTRLRYRLNMAKSAVPDRATSFVSAEGGTFKLDTPDAYKTGQPDVDAVYARYSRREQEGDKPLPASRPLNYDPNWFSLFHGGRR